MSYFLEPHPNPSPKERELEDFSDDYGLFIFISNSFFELLFKCFGCRLRSPSPWGKGWDGAWFHCFS